MELDDVVKSTIGQFLVPNEDQSLDVTNHKPVVIIHDGILKDKFIRFSEKGFEIKEHSHGTI